MKQKSHDINLHWAWLIPFILLLTFIVGARLDMDGFWYDEVFTVRNAGGAGYGPLSLTEIYQTIQADDPYQAIGYPMTITAWGNLVGWSEFALRVSSLLFTVIGLALTYRLGRDATRSKFVGLFAAVIFGFSTFTVHYSHELRAFTFVTIFSAMTLWAYWRILKKPSLSAYVIFTIGGIGILYAHYYAAMLLIALGIYHLIFAPKNKNWLMIPLCGIVTGLAFIPQIPAFIEGFTRFDPADVEKTPMSAYSVLESLLYYIGNGQIILTAIIMLIGLIPAFTQKTQFRIIVGIGILGTAVLVVSNELLNILEPTRLRYAIFLWSLFAVWIAGSILFITQWILEKINQTQVITPVLLLLSALWFGNALYANTTPGFNVSIEGTYTPRMRTLTNILKAEGASADLFAFYNGTSQQAWYIQDTLTYSVWDIPMPTMTTASLYDVNESTRTWAAEQIANTNRIWYGANRTFGLNEVHDDFLALMDEQFVLCETYVMNDDLSLELFARSEVYCNSEDSITNFGGFTLLDSAISNTEETLSVQLAWGLDETVTPETYSLSVQIQENISGEVVTTQDTGIPYDSFVPMQVNVDISELESGDYAVLLVVYNWQTGERFSTATGDTFEIGTFSKN